jgi:hypothetical protein
MFGVALLLCSTTARAQDRTHKFLRNDFDNSHCWAVASDSRSASAMVIKNPGTIAAGKSPGLSLFGDGISQMGFDPQLAVSPKYVLVLEAHRYVFYDRATNKALVSNGCVPLNDTFSSLFAPLLLPTDPKTNAKNTSDVNYKLGFASNPKFPCDPNNYLDPPTPAPPSGCIQGNYDARAYYDFDTNRFWIIAAARNHLTPCDPTDPKEPCGEQAQRYVFVAVSKAEDPRKGFWEYVLVRDYADWPLFSVRNNRLLIGHSGGKRLYVFDSKKLVAGTTTDPFLGQYMDDSFPDADSITTVTQYSDADGLSLVLGAKGNNLTVYAFKDPKKPLVKKTKSLTAPPGWRMQPVYRFSNFYFTDEFPDTDSSRDHVDVHRTTVELKGSLVTVGTITDKRFLIARNDASLRMPGVIIEENGAVIVWYLHFPVDGSQQQARYKVLYANENSFRDSALLRFSDKAATADDFVADRDIGGAAEPDQLGFWITHLYSDSSGTKLQTVGKINQGCGKPKC